MRSFLALTHDGHQHQEKDCSDQQDRRKHDKYAASDFHAVPDGYWFLCVHALIAGKRILASFHPLSETTDKR
jgi:hypothetical protein